MDPNQQPNNPQDTGQPQQPSELPVQPTTPSNGPSQPQTPQQAPPVTYGQPAPVHTTPQAPTAYAPTAQPAYDPNYLDSIAPTAPKAKFLSGSFGKIFFGLLGLVVLAVSLIVALGGKDQTADLQQVSVRLENISKTAKTIQKSLKSNNLSATNSNFQIWLTGNQAEAENLLKQGDVKKTDYNKAMVASEKTLSTELDKKFEDARLNATLNRVYARTMAIETEKIGNMLNSMAKKSKSSKIRDYAKNASTNLTAIQKSFDSFEDDGN